MLVGLLTEDTPSNLSKTNTDSYEKVNIDTDSVVDAYPAFGRRAA